MPKRKPKAKAAAAPPQNWYHTREVLTNVYAAATGKSVVARLLLGEWVKPTADIAGAKGRIQVRYRGGTGYIDDPELLGPRCLEIYFIDVGQGDAILIQTPEDHRVLIDGGKGDEALAFLENKYRLDKPDNFTDFDAVICTHQDEDHAKGAIPILKHKKLAVRAFYHNGLFRRTDKAADPGPHSATSVDGLLDDPRGQAGLTPLMTKLADALDAADANLKRLAALTPKGDRLKEVQKRLGANTTLKVKRLDAAAASGFVPGFDGAREPLRLEVLWPRASRGAGGDVYPWYGDAGKTVNGNSVVLRIVYGKTAVLLSGDINRAASADILAALGDRDIKADVYKAAHHGSQDFSPAFLERVAPNAAVISSGDERDDVYGHPRAVLVGSIVRHSRKGAPAVFCTELARCYTPLTQTELKKYRTVKGDLYEKSIEGIIHVRCALIAGKPDRLAVGAVYNKTHLKSKTGPSPKSQARDKEEKFAWKWDVWPDPREEGPDAGDTP